MDQGRECSKREIEETDDCGRAKIVSISISISISMSENWKHERNTE